MYSFQTQSQTTSFLHVCVCVCVCVCVGGGGCFCVASLFVKPCQHKTFCSQPKQILKSDRAYLATLNSSDQPSPPRHINTHSPARFTPKANNLQSLCRNQRYSRSSLYFIFLSPPPPHHHHHHTLPVLFYRHHELESVIVDLMYYYESALTGWSDWLTDWLLDCFFLHVCQSWHFCWLMVSDRRQQLKIIGQPLPHPWALFLVRPCTAAKFKTHSLILCVCVCVRACERVCECVTVCACVALIAG